jgi:hypothetical protein
MHNRSQTGIPTDWLSIGLLAVAAGSHKRFKDGAWRLTIEGRTDPITGRRKQVHRTDRAPGNRAGAKAADLELAKLVVEVDSRRTLPSSGVTVGQLLERWVEHRRPGWEERSPGQPDATLARIRKHIEPHIGDVVIDRLRLVDIGCGLVTLWLAPKGEGACAARMMTASHVKATNESPPYRRNVATVIMKVVRPIPRVNTFSHSFVKRMSQGFAMSAGYCG